MGHLLGEGYLLHLRFKYKAFAKTFDLSLFLSSGSLRRDGEGISLSRG